MRWLSAVREYIRAASWVTPAAGIAAGFVAGSVMIRMPNATVESGPLRWLIFTGSAEGARALLQVVAGSIITVTSLVFTLTVVVMQLSASAYSPRVLRHLLRERIPRIVLALFLFVFTYSYTVLRTLRTGDDGFVPAYAVSALLLLVVAALVGFVVFIHHVTNSIRVEMILARIKGEVLEMVARAPSEEVDMDPPSGVCALEVRAQRSGVVTDVDVARITRAAEHANAVVVLRSRVGEHVMDRALIAQVWSDVESGGVTEAGALEDAIRSALQLGDERTMQSDVGFGIRQMTDVALRALSPGVNDPTTATSAIEVIGEILARLAQHPSHPFIVARSRDGRPRVFLPTRSFEEHLDLVCRQIRLSASSDPVVLSALLRVLGALEPHAQSRSYRDAILGQIDDLLEEADRSLKILSDRAMVERAGSQARAVFVGADVTRSRARPRSRSRAGP